MNDLRDRLLTAAQSADMRDSTIPYADLMREAAGALREPVAGATLDREALRRLREAAQRQMPTKLGAEVCRVLDALEAAERERDALAAALRIIQKIPPEIEAAIDKLANARFDCGDWRAAWDEPYRVVQDRATAAREALRDAIAAALAQQAPAEQEARWIPVAERLPERGEPVLAAHRYADGVWSRPYLTRWHPDNVGCDWWIGKDPIFPPEVWQPLPAPPIATMAQARTTTEGGSDAPA